MTILSPLLPFILPSPFRFFNSIALEFWQNYLAKEAAGEKGVNKKN